MSEGKGRNKTESLELGLAFSGARSQATRQVSDRRPARVPSRCESRRIFLMVAPALWLRPSRTPGNQFLRAENELPVLTEGACNRGIGKHWDKEGVISSNAVSGANLTVGVYGQVSECSWTGGSTERSFGRPFKIQRKRKRILEPFHYRYGKPADPPFKTHGWQGP